MSAPVKETITWVTDGSLPDSDESVLVEWIYPEGHEVWPGFHDGTEWMSVEGFPMRLSLGGSVGAWARMPVGTKAEADPELVRLKTDAIQMRAIIGEQGAMINRLQVMLKAAQEATAQASGLIVADAIAKACR